MFSLIRFYFNINSRDPLTTDYENAFKPKNSLNYLIVFKNYKEKSVGAKEQLCFLQNDVLTIKNF